MKHPILQLNIAALILAALTACAACQSPETPRSAEASTTRAAEFKVTIDNFMFKPQEISVPVGATITWVNVDDVPHTATSTDNPMTFDSGPLDTDDHFSHTFTKAGTFAYFCKVHPHMTGIVVVK